MSEPILAPVGRNDNSITTDQSVGGFDWAAGFLSVATRGLGALSFLILFGLGSTGCAPRPQAEPSAEADAAVRPRQEVDLSNIRRNPVIRALPDEMLSRVDEDVATGLQEDHFLLVAQGDTAVECEDQACLQGVREGRSLSAEDFSLIGVSSRGRHQRRPNRRQMERGARRGFGFECSIGFKFVRLRSGGDFANSDRGKKTGLLHLFANPKRTDCIRRYGLLDDDLNGAAQ